MTLLTTIQIFLTCIVILTDLIAHNYFIFPALVTNNCIKYPEQYVMLIPFLSRFYYPDLRRLIRACITMIINSRIDTRMHIPVGVIEIYNGVASTNTNQCGMGSQCPYYDIACVPAYMPLLMSEFICKFDTNHAMT